jgi:hypothetical protein
MKQSNISNLLDSNYWRPAKKTNLIKVVLISCDDDDDDDDDDEINLLFSYFVYDRFC